MATGMIPCPAMLVQLWVNPNPTSSFAAQTVSVDLSKYRWIVITAKQQSDTSSDMSIATLVEVGVSSQLSIPNVGSTQYFYKRSITTSSSGVTFTTGYRNTSGTAATSYCIPMAIYGLC